MRAIGALAGVAVALLLALGAVGGGADPAGESRAAGYAALLPNGNQGGIAAASGAGERSTAVSGLRPAGGGTIARVALTLSAEPGSARGRIAISGLRMLDGRVTADAIRIEARAATDTGMTGLTSVDVAGLAVDGVAVAAGAGSRVEVPGLGAIILGEQATDGAGGLRANALRVEVTDPGASSLIGGPLIIGHLDLTAADAPAREHPRAPRSEPEPSAPSVPPTAPPPATTEEAPTPIAPAPVPFGLPRRPAPTLTVPVAAGYAFPVVGEVGFTDDYGAPRAGTGTHHGNDLFAERGTPVVAVADGSLSRVGINTLGGNRLWLTDDRGNAFYYAHLSAYAPAAVEGARVAAGQVIGFVGDTGQARTTPPHLHFEIHPEGGESINPYPYLLAWRSGGGVPRVYRQAAISPGPAPAAGAVLVDGVPELDRAPVPADGLATPAT